MKQQVKIPELTGLVALGVPEMRRTNGGSLRIGGFAGRAPQSIRMGAFLGRGPANSIRIGGFINSEAQSIRTGGLIV